MNDLSLSVARTINAPIEAVFNAWLNPKLLAQFMMPLPEMTVPMVSVDPVEGGRFQLIMAGADMEILHEGEYLQIRPFSKLIFSWESPYSPAGSTVTLDFSEAKAGTAVTLTHIKFIDEEARNNHQNGWRTILNVLEKVLAKGEHGDQHDNN